jgi:hypothetical protein
MRGCISYILPQISFFFLWLYNTIQALAASMELSVPLTRSRTVGRTPWTGDHLVARPLPVHKHRKTHTRQKHYTFMPTVGFELFEPTVPASARAKAVDALDRSATVTGPQISLG